MVVLDEKIKVITYSHVFFFVACNLLKKEEYVCANNELSNIKQIFKKYQRLTS